MKTLLAEHFKKIRKSLGMTQQEFADFLGINRGYISVIETNRVERLSEPLLNLIELKTGFSKEWIRTGKGVEGVAITEQRIDISEDASESEFMLSNRISLRAPYIKEAHGYTSEAKEKRIPEDKMRLASEPATPPALVPAKKLSTINMPMQELKAAPVHPSALLDEDDEIHARVESILTHYRRTGDLSFLREVITGLWKQKKNWKARALKAEEIVGDIKSTLKGKK